VRPSWDVCVVRTVSHAGNNRLPKSKQSGVSTSQS
jgi:hypothetical protein